MNRRPYFHFSLVKSLCIFVAIAAQGCTHAPKETPKPIVLSEKESTLCTITFREREGLKQASLSEGGALFLRTLQSQKAETKSPLTQAALCASHKLADDKSGAQDACEKVSFKALRAWALNDFLDDELDNRARESCILYAEKRAIEAQKSGADSLGIWQALHEREPTASRFFFEYTRKRFYEKQSVKTEELERALTKYDDKTMLGELALLHARAQKASAVHWYERYLKTLEASDIDEQIRVRQSLIALYTKEGGADRNAGREKHEEELLLLLPRNPELLRAALLRRVDEELAFPYLYQLVEIAAANEDERERYAHALAKRARYIDAIAEIDRLIDASVAFKDAGPKQRVRIKSRDAWMGRFAGIRVRAFEGRLSEITPEMFEFLTPLVNEGFIAQNRGPGHVARLEIIVKSNAAGRVIRVKVDKDTLQMESIANAIHLNLRRATLAEKAGEHRVVLEFKNGI